MKKLNAEFKKEVQAKKMEIPRWYGAQYKTTGNELDFYRRPTELIHILDQDLSPLWTRKLSDPKDGNFDEVCSNIDEMMTKLCF